MQMSLNIKEAKAGEQVWVLTFYGPRVMTYRMAWTNGKVLVETGEEPELLVNPCCFATKAECYAAAIAKKNAEALKALEDVRKLSEEALKTPNLT